jgi:hypothetical protein
VDLEFEIAFVGDWSAWPPSEPAAIQVPSADPPAEPIAEPTADPAT